MENVSRETLAKWLFVETEYLNEFCDRNRLDVSEMQKEQLLDYAKWIWETNQVINLVSRKDEINILRRHICHALSINILAPTFKTKVCIDLGTGGGIPGIPFAITHPESKVLLVDSIQKKINALQSYIEGYSKLESEKSDEKFKIGSGNRNPDINVPKNIYTMRARVEEPTVAKHKNVDAVITRGVATISTILDWTTDLRESKNSFTYVFLKGGMLEEEFEPIPLAIKKKMKDISVHPITHFGSDFIGEEKYVIKIEF